MEKALQRANSIEANLVVNEITKLSWNMQAFRTLDEFGAFATGKLSMYFDSGYTHPSVALRILQVNDMIGVARTQLGVSPDKFQPFESPL